MCWIVCRKHNLNLTRRCPRTCLQYKVCLSRYRDSHDKNRMSVRPSLYWIRPLEVPIVPDGRQRWFIWHIQYHGLWCKEPGHQQLRTDLKFSWNILAWAPEQLTHWALEAWAKGGNLTWLQWWLHEDVTELRYLNFRYMHLRHSVS